MSVPTMASSAAELAAAIVPTMTADFGASVGKVVADNLAAARITGRVFASLTKEDVAELFPNLAWGERRTLWLLAQQVGQSDAPLVAASLGQTNLATPSATGAAGGGGTASVVTGRQPGAPIGTGRARSSPAGGVAARSRAPAWDGASELGSPGAPAMTTVEPVTAPVRVLAGGFTNVSAAASPTPQSGAPCRELPTSSGKAAAAAAVKSAGVKTDASASVPPIPDVEVTPALKPVVEVIVINDDTEEEVSGAEDDEIDRNDGQAVDGDDEQLDDDGDNNDVEEGYAGDGEDTEDEEADSDDDTYDGESDNDDDVEQGDSDEDMENEVTDADVEHGYTDEDMKHGDTDDALQAERSDSPMAPVSAVKGSTPTAVSSAVPRRQTSDTVSLPVGGAQQRSAPKRPRPNPPTAPAKRLRTDAPANLATDEVDEITPVRTAPLSSVAAVSRLGGGRTAVASATAAAPRPPAPRATPPPSFVLGVCGPTGAGKSTVLNAILDGSNVLPTSAMHACTAVPIEIRYKAPSTTGDGVAKAAGEPDADNLEHLLLLGEAEEEEDLLADGDSDGRFGAEIEFICADDWTAMLTTAADVVRRKAERRHTLEDSLTQTGATADPAARAAAMEQFCDGEDLDDAGASHLASVKAVLNGQLFPTLAEFQAHCRTPAVRSVLHFLGQTLHFYEDRPAGISRRIARFLATNTGKKSGPSVWPLVRKAVVSGPWALLSGGLTIVDLPGLGDANSARNSVVCGYIDRCHGILATAPISRARDNLVTKQIFQNQARAGVEAGRIKYLAFLCTQADNVDAAEIVDELGADFVQHYRMGWQAYQEHPTTPPPSVTSAELQLQKVQRLEGRVASLKQQTKAAGVDEAIYLAALSELSEKTRQLRSACVVARNGAVATNLVDQYTEDMADIISNPLSPPGVRTLDVFAVSAVEYEKIMRERGSNAELSSAYTDVRATGIPKLLDALWALSNTSAAVRARGEADMRAAFAARSAPADDVVMADNDTDAVEKFINSILGEDAELCAAHGEAFAPDVLRQAMEKEQEAAIARRRAAVSESAKALQDRTRYLSDISVLNTSAATVLESFLRLCSESSELVASKRRLDMWSQQARDLMMATASGPEASSALIAVLGDSGAGKSTLLNALLQVDDGGVVPVSGVRACTAAPIEISYCVAEPGAEYQATVEFLTADEWHTELVALLSDLADAGVLKKRMTRPGSEAARLAYDRVYSLYGKIASLEELRQTRRVKKLLGSTVTLRESTPKLIRQQLEDYVSSKSDEPADAASHAVAGHVWPIVKMARLRGPFSILSDSGGRLLDLPGLQDSNAARNAVVQSYLSQCSSFLIAAPIRRAIDNKTARELLGRQFRRQLLLDGRMGSVAFVATATDDLDALQVAAELGIKGVATYSGISEAAVSGKLRAHVPFVRRLRKRVTSVAEMQMQLTQRLRRDTSSLQRKTDALAAGGGDTFRLRTGISRVKARIRKLDSDLKAIREVADKAAVELGQREHIINHLCATARNAFCREHLRVDFAQGMREVMAASVMSSGSTGQDVTDEAPVLPVFTVSSRDYQNLRQQNDKAVAFYTQAQTEVPSLSQYVRHNMLVSRAAAEATRSDRIELLLASVTHYLTLQDRATPGQQASLSLVTKNLAQAAEGHLAKAVKATSGRIELALLKGPLAAAMDMGVTMARKQAPSVLTSIECSMHWATYRMCIKRNGNFTSPTAGHVNINESLSAPLLETAMKAWRSVFGTGLPKLLEVMNADFTKVADQFLEKVVSAVTNVGLSATPLTADLGLSMRRRFELGLTSVATAAELQIKSFQRDAWSSITAAVGKSLEPGYALAAAESGTGCIARLKDQVRCSVEEHRHEMFKAGCGQMRRRMGALVLELQLKLNEASGIHLQELLNSVEMVWDANCGVSAAKCGLLAASLDALKAFVLQVGAASFALRAAMSSVDFDVEESHYSVLPVLTGLGGGAVPLVNLAAARHLLPPAPPARKPKVDRT